MPPRFTDPRFIAHPDRPVETNGSGKNASASAAPSSFLTAILKLLGRLSLLSGLSTMLAALILLRAGYSSIPFWDEMDELEKYVDSMHNSPLAWVWAQHNEHRIIFYKLLVIFNMRFFEGLNWPIYIAIFLCQAGSAILVGYILYNFDNLSGALKDFCLGIALYCLFCPSQWENFFWAFQLSFTMVNVWVLTTIVCVCLQIKRIREGKPCSGRLLFVSLLMASSAPLTNGNGMTVWPVIILLALIAHLPRHLVLIYITGFTLVIAIYLIGYQSPAQHASPLDSIRKPLLIVEFVAKYLGSALVDSLNIRWAGSIGTLALVVVTLMICRLIRCHASATVINYALAGIVLYCLSTAGITALGRLSFGIGQAFAPRYQTFALLLWLALAMWIVVELSRLGAFKSLTAVCLLSLVIIICSARHYGAILDTVRDRITEREVGGIALIVHTYDDKLLKTAILPFPLSEDKIDYLRTHRLSLFSMSVAKELGRSFIPDYRFSSPGACAGSVDVVSYPDADLRDVRLEGWIIDRSTRRPLKTLVFVVQNRVVGFGTSGKRRLDVVSAVRSKRALRSGWIGYAKLPTGDQRVDIYGIVDSSDQRDACHLETIRLADPSR